MKLYYGTTSAGCVRIRRHGIRPTSPSGEIWFSRSLSVAQARARQLCRYQRGRPMVAVCEVDTGSQRQRCGTVRCRGPMVVVWEAVDRDQVTDVLPVEDRRGETDEPVVTSAEVFRYLDSPSPRVRMMGVMMLSSQESPDAFDWICTRLEDPDPRVRLAVAMALRRRGREAADVLAGLGDDKDPRVREAARQAVNVAEIALV